MKKEPTAMSRPLRLTEYSHGAGCGCKISPEILRTILNGLPLPENDPNLITGYAASDDAAAYALDEEVVLLSTADFFMPIVDDPFDFGAIASVNAISDVYAMGGRPIMAIAILGWPIEALGPQIAQDVLAGASAACTRAGIALAGGHSIDSKEPIFGLAVTGTALRSSLRTNSDATDECELYLTKPLGVGVLSTAQKRGILAEKDRILARDLMLSLNDVGPELAELNAVQSMTDVTGFGLLGHLIELCEASNLCAEIWYDAVPQIPSLPEYLRLGAVPGGTKRNADSYLDRVSPLSDEQRSVLCDPQTSGGLLLAVHPRQKALLNGVFGERGMQLIPFGILRSGGTQHHLVEVR